MSFARFMELALYHPTVGYYRRNLPRVGYARGTDFYTSTTSGAVFGALVAESCQNLLGGRDPRAHTFVEIGAEPGQSVLQGVEHPFGSVRTVRIGEPLDIAGDCVVFSNELFDAQPCIRTVFRRGRWYEIAVKLEDGSLVEVELPFDNPVPAPEGYLFDRPKAAAELATTIAAQPWRGLFVACDYGKTFLELTECTPGGTARAYYRHEQSNDLLAHPGEQDLTCHICWDWISAALRERGFSAPVLDFQETFFVRHAARYLQTVIAADATIQSPRKRSVTQLLHPAQLGQKFQVLHALR